MKILRFLFLSTAIFTVNNVFCQNKAIVILLDGVPAEVLENTNTPFLDEIASKQGYTRAYVGGKTGTYTETPTISAPGYMNMITGVWGYKHNVWGNSVKNPNYNYWNFFRAVEDAKPELKTAIFSTWEDNRTKLIGEGKANAGILKLDYSFDGFERDTVRFPHKADRKYISEIDELVSRQAANYIEQQAPDLSWVYLEFTDDMGHKFGYSPEMTKAVEDADQQVGRIWQSIQKRQKETKENWMIVVTTDHGRTSDNGKHHGGQSAGERTTWMVTNHVDVNQEFKDEPAIIDIMPSVLRHLEVEMPKEQKAEVDGIPFIGKLSIKNAHANIDGNTLTVDWEPIDTKGKVEVYVSYADNYSSGQQDNYKLLDRVAVKNGAFKSELDTSSDKIKILLKARHNWCNAWVVK